MRASELLARVVSCKHEVGETFPTANSELCVLCGSLRKYGTTEWARPTLIEDAAREGAREPNIPRAPDPDTRVIGPLELTPRGPAEFDGMDRVRAEVREVQVVFRNWCPAIATLDTIEAAEVGQALLSMVVMAGAMPAAGPPLPAPGVALHSEAGRSPIPGPPSGAYPIGELIEQAAGCASRPTFLLGILRGSLDGVLDATPGDEMLDAVARVRRIVEVIDREMAGPERHDTEPPAAMGGGT